MDPATKFSMLKVQDVVVVELSGDVWGGWDSIQLKDSVGAMLKSGERKFLIDLGQTRMVNSAGIGVLLAVKEAVETVRGTLLLCAVSERTQRTIAISEVWGEFASHATRAEALAALGASSEESSP